MKTIKVCFMSTKRTEIQPGNPYAIPEHVADLMKVIDFPEHIVTDCALCQAHKYRYTVPFPQPWVFSTFVLQQVHENGLTAVYRCETCNMLNRIYMDNRWACIDAVDIPLKDESQ